MLKELSPELLQHAADKSREMRRYKQADNLETGAIDTVNNELNPGGQDKNIRYGVNNVAWVTPDKWSCVLCSNGQYRTSHLYGRGLTTTGTLSGTEIVPKEMKTDPAQARKIVNWWKRFGQAELPQFTDWHNLVNYDVREDMKLNENDIKNIVNEVVGQMLGDDAINRNIYKELLQGVEYFKIYMSGRDADIQAGDDRYLGIAMRQIQEALNQMHNIEIRKGCINSRPQ